MSLDYSQRLWKRKVIERAKVYTILLVITLVSGIEAGLWEYRKQKAEASADQMIKIMRDRFEERYPGASEEDINSLLGIFLRMAERESETLP